MLQHHMNWRHLKIYEVTHVYVNGDNEFSICNILVYLKHCFCSALLFKTMYCAPHELEALEDI